jgi:hypothetical protein
MESNLKERIRSISSATTVEEKNDILLSIKSLTGGARDELLLKNNGFLKQVIEFCRVERLLYSTLHYLRSLSANQQYKQAFIISDVVEIVLPFVHQPQLRKDVLMLLQNISEGRFKDGSYNMFQNVIISQGALSHISAYCDEQNDKEIQFFAVLIAANLSLNPNGLQECKRLKLLEKIRNFVDVNSSSFIPNFCWNTLQSLVYLLSSEVEEVRIFGLYTLKLFGPNHELQLWKALCVHSSINTIVKMKNSTDPLAARIATEVLEFCEINTNYLVSSASNPSQQLTHDLNQLYHQHIIPSEKIYSLENPLVWIKVGEVYVPVNREIVSVRSSYFKALLSTEWQRSNPIVIEDISLEVFHKVLEFLYSAHVDINWENVVPILEAADKLGIDQLKKHCETLLLQAIDFDTVENLITIADLFTISELFNYCEKFIVANWLKFSQKKNNLPNHLISNLKQKAEKESLLSSSQNLTTFRT